MRVTAGSEAHKLEKTAWYSWFNNAIIRASGSLCLNSFSLT